MAAMPLPFLLNRIAGLLSLLLLLTGGWFIADWARQENRSDVWLYLGSFLLAFSLFGRLAVMRLLAAGSPEPEVPSDDLQHGEGETITGSGGAKLHVECFGPRDAPVLILTHGAGLDRTLWNRTVRDLCERYRVLVWDLPGVGLSHRPFDGLYSLDRFAMDLGAVLLLANGKPTVLVGHGLGGMAALKLCAEDRRLTRHVRGLALFHTPDGPPVEAGAEAAWLKPLEPWVIAPLQRLSILLSPLTHLGAWAAYLNGLWHLVVRAAGFGDAPHAADIERVALMSTRHAPSVQAKHALAMRSWRAEGLIEALDLPMLVVAGGSDNQVCPPSVQALAARSVWAEPAVVERAGHLGPLEQAGDYDRLLARFAERVFRQTRAQRHAEVLAKQSEAVEIHSEGSSWASGDPATPGEPPVEPTTRRASGYSASAGRA
jgi:pimeloyl-ACP methyl ester carboxylesterase